MATRVESWWIFIKERFPLGSHIPMVGLFTLGNMTLSQHLLGMEGGFASFPLIFIMAFLFFFRLRCFDEIKDYAVDLRVNPTRPLARGILTIKQVKVMIGVVSIVELAMASRLGWGPSLMHALAMAYSFLMYKEFFIGRYLSPHLTTYAVTHTFVSMLLGWSISSQVAPVVNAETMKAVIWIGPINWALFNLFEFARKTFAPDEERPTVESYSSLFGPLGAVLLSLSQVLVALLALWTLPLQGFLIQVLCALVPLGAGLYFVAQCTRRAAGLFRGLTGAYLLLFYIVLSYQAFGL